MVLRRQRRGAGELEATVLELLWERREPMSVAEVKAALDDGLAYTTLMTILVRMHAKGLVRREARGRAFAYTAATDRAGIGATRMRRVLDEEDDRGSVLMRFVDSLPPEDERVLRDLLAARGSEEPPDTEEPADGPPR